MGQAVTIMTAIQINFKHKEIILFKTCGFKTDFLKKLNISYFNRIYLYVSTISWLATLNIHIMFTI